MNQLQVFQYVGNEVRTVIKDGSPWFVLKDVVQVLGLSNSRMVKERLGDDVSSTYPIPDSLGREQETTIINEDGLYDVILESRKPEARAFRKWITGDVLPTIRKTGSYSVTVPSYMIDDPIKRAEQWITEQREKQALETKSLMLEQRVAEYEPKISYLDRILQSKGTVTITQIAKDYGMSGQALNLILHEEKVQYKQNKQWLLYRQHHDKGYTKSETIDITRSNGDPDVTMNTRWTQKGRLFIHELLQRRGIVPLMDREPRKKGESA
ncbi:phage antirepressor [Paenibacillus melissococcoides]|uniref:Phage antirepressor n=1 Tax=Paenibacillus melissococcoides TaxID=2912268 RepID=A0ABM9G3M5_9BACL|nr:MULTISPECIES: phage antirepressor [Paenibacillus]GIO82258.1 hypothetical protein J6TS7_58680 [Paenibacillus dendritiformis]CAH8246302.1 phage antirepressor [Paenibacillus melissococcoides]CAH8713562.1 phage antirepressor [Paenibacillus melissococcoides]CAH8714295.1 phage antirepressor [Paenibacillus melissococcoides]